MSMKGTYHLAIIYMYISNELNIQIGIIQDLQPILQIDYLTFYFTS